MGGQQDHSTISEVKQNDVIFKFTMQARLGNFTPQFPTDAVLVSMWWELYCRQGFSL